MTNTTTTAKALTIPPAGLRHEANGTVIVARPTAQCGYQIQVRVDGAFRHGEHHAHDTHAVAAYNRLVAEHTPAAVEAPVKLAAPARGTATRMTPAEVAVIGQALDSTGHIRRGRGHAAADLKSLLAMARRGFITLTGPRFRPDGGEVTDFGKRIHKEAIAAADAEQQRADRLAAILTNAA